MSKETVEFGIKITSVGEGIPEEIRKHLVGLETTVKGVTEKTDKMTGAFFKLNQAVDAVKNIAGALSSIDKTFGEFTSEYMAVSEAQTKLEQVMRNTMNAADEEVRSVIELAEAQQQLGVVSADAATAGAQELATYLEKSKNLKSLIPVMNDIVAQQYGYNATSESAVQIATMMGKVMEGQTSALSRYGYSFSDAEKKILEMGNEEERAATLAEVISRSVGGVNIALAATPAGKFKQLSNNISDVKASIGKALMPLKGFVSTAAGVGEGAAGFVELGAAIGTVAKSAKVAAIAQKAFNLVVKASPYVAAATALVAIGTAIYKISQNTSQAAKNQKIFKDALHEAQTEIAAERTQADYLFASLQNAQRGSDEYKKALERINQVYGEYLPNLLNEKSSLDEIKKAYDRVTSAVQTKILTQLKDRAIAEATADLLQKEVDASNKIRQNVVASGRSQAEAGDFVNKLVAYIKNARREGENFYAVLHNVTEALRPLDPGMMHAGDWAKELIKPIYEVENAIIEAERQFEPFIKGMKDIKTEIKSGNDENASLVAGMYGYDEQEIRRLQKLLKNASGEEYAAILRQIEVHRKAIAARKKDEKDREKEQAKEKDLVAGQYGYEEQQVKKLKELLNKATGEEIANIQRQINALEKLIKKRNEHLALMSPSEMKVPKAPEMPKVKIDLKKETKALDGYIERRKKAFGDEATEQINGQELAISSLSSAFEDLGAAIDGSAGAWLTWAGKTVQAIGTALPKIWALCFAEKTEANEAARNAILGSAASASKVPIVGAAMAIAAVASVTAALLSIPKFAAGGLAYGPTLGMFGEYQGASSNPEVIAPLSKLRDLIGDSGMGGDVRFRISGRDLEGVLEKRIHYGRRT